MPEKAETAPLLQDTAFYVALFMALFTIAFGTRQLDVAERHEGMVAAIAFESIVKLVAFLAVGVYVTYGMFDGFGDIFQRAAARGPTSPTLMTPFAAPTVRYASWVVADGALDARDRVPAAPVPGRGDRERRREAPEDARCGFSRSTCWRSTCSCCRSPSAACCVFPQGVDADTFVLTLPMSHAHGGARAAGVRRRALGGHGHGDRGDHRALDDGLQRPGDAVAAALEALRPRLARRRYTACCSTSAAARSS